MTQEEWDNLEDFMKNLPPMTEDQKLEHKKKTHEQLQKELKQMKKELDEFAERLKRKPSVN